MKPDPRRVVAISFFLALAGGAEAAPAPVTAPDPAPVTAPDPAPRGVLVSRQLAAARGLERGDVIRLSAQPTGADARSFRIDGIYEPNPDPMLLTATRYEARFVLDDFLELTSDPADPLALETVSSLQIALRNPNDAEAFARDLMRRSPTIQAAPTSLPRPGDPFLVLERFHLAVAIVTVLGSAAFLLALMVMRADERREVVGILRVLGFSRRRILLEVLVEGAILAVAGAVFGVLFALSTEGIVNRIFQWRYDTPLVFVRVTAPIAFRSVAFAVPLGVLAGLVASWSLLRLRIGALLGR